MQTKYKLFFLVTLFMLSGMGCETSDSKNPQYEMKVKPDKSTAEMIAKVREAYGNINPEMVTTYVLNKMRSDLMKRKLDKMTPGSDMNKVLFLYAEELLRVGETDKAIAIFKDFLQFYEPKNFPNKMVILSEFRKKLAICYIRKAEQENCINNHTNESCIIPISNKAQHLIKDGSNMAIQYLKEYLETNPLDYEAQYLLNIATMTIGKYPEDVPADFLIPEKYFAQSDFPQFHDVAMELGVDVNHMAGGTCVDDFNNDGYLDIVASSWGMNDQIVYFENNKEGGFVDKTAFTGLVGVTGGLNLKHADYNNDGNLDFIILRGAWLQDFGKIPNSLIRNNGDGTFTDVTIEAGLFSTRPTQTAVWSDFNLDGWLDIFIANESGQIEENNCELYLNNANGTFTNIADKCGIDAVGFFKGVASGDINNDGYQDIYISNFNGKNILYINTSDKENISFKPASDSLSLFEPIMSFSTWIFDYNNDGFEDIFVSGYSSDNKTPVNLMMANIKQPLEEEIEAHRPRLYKNNGDGTFINVSSDVGLLEPVTTMGCNFGDLNNDGFLDFYLATGDPSFFSIVPNKMYLNKNGNYFEDVTYSGGFGHIQKGHAVGFGDLDLDGDQDIYAVMGGAYEGDNFQNILFENPIGNKDNWINIILQGTTSNRCAIGAKIEITVQEDGISRKIYSTISSGSSFGGNSLMAEIGLGRAKIIDSIIVMWPNRIRGSSKFTSVDINKVIRIKEGEESVEYLNLPAVPFTKGNHHHH